MARDTTGQSDASSIVRREMRVVVVVFVSIVLAFRAAGYLLTSLKPSNALVALLVLLVAALGSFAPWIPASLASMTLVRRGSAGLGARAWLPLSLSLRTFSSTLLVFVGMTLCVQGVLEVAVGIPESTWAAVAHLPWHEVYQPVDWVFVLSSLAIYVGGIAAYNGLLWRAAETAWSRTSAAVLVGLVELVDPAQLTLSLGVAYLVHAALRWVTDSLGPSLVLIGLTVVFETTLSAYPLLTPRVGPLGAAVGVGVCGLGLWWARVPRSGGTPG